MNTPKKILTIGLSIGAIVLIASLAGWAVSAIFGVSFWAVFTLVVLGQLATPYLFEQYTYSKKIRNAVQEYANKPYKKYQIKLNCQYCSHSQPVEIDLDDTVFKCEQCERKNAIYVAFTPVAISNE